MASPSYFTVNADMLAIVGASGTPATVPIRGKVSFTPMIKSGDALVVPTLSPRPGLVSPQPITGIIGSDGRLGFGGAVGVRLIADTSVLGLTSPLFYTVSFTGLTVNGVATNLTPFNFQAATSDTPINLVSVARVPGQLASGIVNNLTPDHVRRSGSTAVFSANGVDLPDPIDLTTVSEPPITAGTTGQYWRGDKTWQTLNKAAVGLTNVDNTSDTSKPVSTAQAAADTAVANASVPRGRVFDALDYGVIADGAQHNNVANLLDCFAAAAAAGAREVVLPAGVIDTSEAVAGATVTANGGATYTNNGGIPWPVNQPMTISGHGEGVTVLKLSAGFPRGFDAWYIADGQIYKQIHHRDFTIDRNNLTGAGIAPSTAVTGSATLTHGSVWTTLPGISAVTFKNARAVYFPPSNAGTAKSIAMAARVSGSNFQVRNDHASIDYTLSSGDHVQGALRDHVIAGTKQFAGTNPEGLNMTFDDITFSNVTSINVATMTAASVTTAKADQSPNIWMVVGQNPANPVMIPSVTNCWFDHVRMNGGEGGLTVTGGLKTFIDEVWAYDCFHDTGVNPPSNYESGNFHFGGYAWVGRVGLVRCKGRRSGDIAYEFNQPWDGVEQDCVWEDSFSGNYRTTFVPPAQTAAGPPTTTLSGSLTNVASSTTIAALPAGVARRGLMRVDTELIWYVANSTAGTALTIYRGVNGTTAASHSSGATVTFVETFKTRINSVRSTIHNSVVMSLTNGGRCYTSFENSSLPLPPLTISSPHIQLAGGDLTFGQFMYWDGWQPDLVLEGVKFAHDGLVTASGNFGASIAWDWIAGPAFVTNSVPIPAPRVYGRNNRFRVHAVFTGGGWFGIFGPDRGYAQVDLDIDGEVVLAGSGNGSYASLAYLDGPHSKMVFAPGSRLGLKARLPAGMASDIRPSPIYLGGTGNALIQTVLDLDIDASEQGFNVGTGDTDYAPWHIDSSQLGKVRFGRIQHSAAATSNYALSKRMAVKVSGTYTVTAQDDIVLCDTSGGAVTVNLPASTGGNSGVGEPLSRGRVLTIVDAGFNSATNNITIHPVTADKLDNGTAGANVTVSTNGAHKTYVAYAAMPGWVSI